MPKYLQDLGAVWLATTNMFHSGQYDRKGLDLVLNALDPIGAAIVSMGVPVVKIKVVFKRKSARMERGRRPRE